MPGHTLRKLTTTTMATIPRLSPVTLSNAYPKLERLLFLIFCTCVGSIMNGFFIAAFFIEHTLKKVGNVFLACVGLSDLIITMGVMSTSAIVLLSGEWDTIPVCHALHFVTMASAYSYSIFFGFVGIESYYRFCRATVDYEWFMSMRIGLVAIAIFIISFTAAWFGVYMEMDYDYCERRHFGDYYYRVTTSVLFHAIPCILTFYGLFCSLARIRRKFRRSQNYRRSQQYARDLSITKLNIAAYVFYVIGWIPYLIIVFEYPGTSDSTFYHSVWIGVSRSVVTSVMYSSVNRSFRRAFSRLFNYCCCKTALSTSFRRRRHSEQTPTTDVRVHIMHKAVKTSPQRAASSSRDIQEL